MSIYSTFIYIYNVAQCILTFVKYRANVAKDCQVRIAISAEVAIFLSMGFGTGTKVQTPSVSESHRRSGIKEGEPIED